MYCGPNPVFLFLEIMVEAEGIAGGSKVLLFVYI
jgi:hypothetical protein